MEEGTETMSILIVTENDTKPKLTISTESTRKTDSLLKLPSPTLTQRNGGMQLRGFDGRVQTKITTVTVPGTIREVVEILTSTGGIP